MGKFLLHLVQTEMPGGKSSSLVVRQLWNSWNCDRSTAVCLETRDLGSEDLLWTPLNRLLWWCLKFVIVLPDGFLLKVVIWQKWSLIVMHVYFSYLIPLVDLLDPIGRYLLVEYASRESFWHRWVLTSCFRYPYHLKREWAGSVTYLMIRNHQTTPQY